MSAAPSQRHINLRILQGRTPYQGSPKSDHVVTLLNQHGHNVTSTQVSAIYAGDSDISDQLARQIEQAFSLPVGWLDSSHEYAFKTEAMDQVDIEALLALSMPVRQAVSTLLQHLNHAQSPKAAGLE